MKRLVGKGFDSIGTAYNAAQQWLWDNYPSSFDCSFHKKEHRYAKYLAVKGKPYRVYFFEKAPNKIDAYFFSTLEESNAEIEKRRKKEWAKRRKSVAPPITEAPIIEEEEIEVPEPCASCPVEPICVAASLMPSCPNREIYGNYMAACHERMKRKKCK